MSVGRKSLDTGGILMRPLKIALVLLVTASSLAACDEGEGHRNAGATRETPCPLASELASLSAAPILAEKPAGARQVESYAECSADEAPSAGRFYETSMTPAD